jgi:HEAT repeat protein
VAVAVVGSATLLARIPISGPDWSALTLASDVVVVGRVTLIADRPPVDLSFQDRTAEAAQKVATIAVAQWIKGEGATGIVQVHYMTTRPDLGYEQPQVSDGERVFFMKGSVSNLIPTDRYHLSVIGRSTQLSANDDSDEVAQVISEVLRHSGVSVSERIEAVVALGFTRSQFADAALEEATSDDSSEVSARAIASLVARGDEKALGRAVDLLLAPGMVRSELLAGVRVGIDRGPLSEGAIPDLRKLQSSNNPADRRSAVAAIGRMGSALGIPALVDALSDSDQDVRFAAVNGMARATGERNRTVSRPAFDRRESTYLDYWVDWARQRGLSR